MRRTGQPPALRAAPGDAGELVGYVARMYAGTAVAWEKARENLFEQVQCVVKPRFRMHRMTLHPTFSLGSERGGHDQRDKGEHLVALRYLEDREPGQLHSAMQPLPLPLAWGGDPLQNQGYRHCRQFLTLFPQPKPTPRAQPTDSLA